jgi:hypothetical protein
MAQKLVLILPSSFKNYLSCAPDSAEGTGSSGLLVFPVLSGPPPPCAQGGGGGRGLRLTVRRWASSLSSFYSVFFVEKWST